MKSTLLRSAPLLVVEDNSADFETISLLLREAGVKSPIVHCRTGEEAVSYAASVSEKVQSEKVPVHVLLDLNLPGMSGLEVLEELRGNGIFTVVPVTILTTSSHPRDINGCYRAGANSYLIKPVDFDHFERMLRSFVAYWFEVAEHATPGGAYA